jgi:UDP-N-acetylglucosamine diphosphorylase/glucosamine-1-phosphate N-acetyltransferase
VAEQIPVTLFDDGAGVLAPLTDLRAAFDIRTGAFTTLERLQRQPRFRLAALRVPEPLAAITRERHQDLPVNAPGQEPPESLLVNGRWADAAVDEALVQVVKGDAFRGGSGALLATWVDPKDAARRIAGDFDGLIVHDVEADDTATTTVTRPWHIRARRDLLLAFDLDLLRHLAGQPHAPTLVAASARIHASAVLDSEGGPIVIDARAEVRPGAVICGPAHIGAGSVVSERAIIRGNTAIGPVCKVGGEVGGTIFQGHANKAHDGYLGDSYIGEWVNLGAGTTNSNLLNTYGEVVAWTLDGHAERSGETFLGCTLGDHVKAAVCTRIMTGAIVGTGTMWAASMPVTGAVAPFRWITDTGNRPYRLEKFMETCRAMMRRRDQAPGGAYAARLRELHEAAG